MPQTPTQVLACAELEIQAADRLLKIAQVARMANVSERTVWRDIKAGYLSVCYPKPRRPRVPLLLARLYASGNARQFATFHATI